MAPNQDDHITSQLKFYMGSLLSTSPSCKNQILACAALQTFITCLYHHDPDKLKELYKEATADNGTPDIGRTEIMSSRNDGQAWERPIKRPRFALEPMTVEPNTSFERESSASGGSQASIPSRSKSTGSIESKTLIIPNSTTTRSQSSSQFENPPQSTCSGDQTPSPSENAGSSKFNALMIPKLGTMESRSASEVENPPPTSTFSGDLEGNLGISRSNAQSPSMDSTNRESGSGVDRLDINPNSEMHHKSEQASTINMEVDNSHQSTDTYTPSQHMCTESSRILIGEPSQCCQLQNSDEDEEADVEVDSASENGDDRSHKAYEEDIALVRGDSAILAKMKAHCMKFPFRAYRSFKRQMDPKKEVEFKKALELKKNLEMLEIFSTCHSLDFCSLKARLLIYLKNRLHEPGTRTAPFDWDVNDTAKVCAALERFKSTEGDSKIHRAFGSMTLNDLVDKEAYGSSDMPVLERRPKRKVERGSKFIAPHLVILEDLARTAAGNISLDEVEAKVNNYISDYHAGKRWREFSHMFGGTSIVIILATTEIGMSYIADGWSEHQRECMRYLAQYLRSIRAIAEALGLSALRMYCSNGYLDQQYIHKVKAVEGYFAPSQAPVSDFGDTSVSESESDWMGMRGGSSSLQSLES